jgi:hypothetical protein
MKKRIYNLLFLLVGAGIISMGVTSCKEYNEWEIDKSYDRLFRPSDLTATVEGVTASLKFKAKPNTTTYRIEISKDSLKFENIVFTYVSSPTKTAEGYSFQIPDLLEPLTQYSVRIRGIDSTEVKPESEWSQVAFKSLTEQIMQSVTLDDLTPTSVVLRWNTPNQVSHFMIGTTRYDITAEEKTAGEKTITGLTEETTYTTTLYLNSSIRGTQSFTTPPNLPTGPGVVIVGATDDLASMIQSATSSTQFVLLAGTKYNSDATVNIPNGIDINIWGQVSENKPIVSFNQIMLPTSGGTLHFENIELTGYANGDNTTSKRAYLINQNVATNMQKVSFENCTINHFANSPMRIQSANSITINTFSVNNCIVEDIGDNGSNGTYAFINNNVATGKINNITLTNSTFNVIGYGLILHSLSPSQRVTIENNTFYNTIGNGRLLIDYNAQTIGSSGSNFIFRNNIIGKTLSSAASARGIRAGTVPTVTNSFFTGNSIPGIISYTKTSNELFTAPTSSNFLIKDAGFDGRATAGDPRWRIQ